MNFGPTKKSDAPIPCRPCNVKLSPCAATLPKELWEGVFNGLRKGFMTTGHPKIEGLEGACKCGKLEFVVNGELATAMMCHCHMCRKYFSQSTPTPTLWVQPEDAVTITKGKEFYTSWLVPKLSRNLRGQATCYFSKCCGTQIHVQFSDPNGDFTLMWPYNFKLEEWGDTSGKGDKARHGYIEMFRPRFHAHYENRAVDHADDLPKLADIWLEGMPMMNSKGDVVGTVQYPLKGFENGWMEAEVEKAQDCEGPSFAIMPKMPPGKLVPPKPKL